jgi:5-methylcytosine-specific restriction protein A
MKITISEETHFIAHYLAKFPDSYESLRIGNNTQTHNKICEVIDIKESSFRRLRDEYDGFYENRKGFPYPEKRKSRVEYKNLFDKIKQDVYIQKINLILSKENFEINFDEQIEDNPYYEGEKIRIEINRYERNQKAKKECLEYYGRKCEVCNFDDKNSIYSNINIIEVHHLKPLHENNEKHKVDPVKDLRPVCPNCHRALHSKKKAISIEELKEIIKTTANTV